MMTIPVPLTLSNLQQSWLQEIQVATPFIAAHRQKTSASPMIATTVSELEPQFDARVVSSVASDVATSARQALSESLALLQPNSLKRVESETPIATPQVVLRNEQAISLPAELAQMDLMQLQAYANQCQACELHEQRVQAVVGAGQVKRPEWMVISTAPSSGEELSGLPMQGKSGELFAAQMQSIGIQISQELYITQLLKCRSNTKQTSEYIAACKPILWRQIELIQPKRLLLLGSKAAAIFLGEQIPFESLRGQIHQWQDNTGRSLPVVVSYHPSSILLRPQNKAKSWADLVLMLSAQ